MPTQRAEPGRAIHDGWESENVSPVGRTWMSRRSLATSRPMADPMDGRAPYSDGLAREASWIGDAGMGGVGLIDDVELGDRLAPVLRQNYIRQRGASSSARRPGCTGNRTLRKPERIAPCRLRSLRETLTRRGGRGATAYPPRGGLATQRRLSDCKHWGVGAPGGTRTPGIRLRSPSALSAFSASYRTRGTFEDTNRRLGARLRRSALVRRASRGGR